MGILRGNDNHFPYHRSTGTGFFNFHVVKLRRISKLGQILRQCFRFFFSFDICCNPTTRKLTLDRPFRISGIKMELHFAYLFVIRFGMVAVRKDV